MASTEERRDFSGVVFFCVIPEATNILVVNNSYANIVYREPCAFRRPLLFRFHACMRFFPHRTTREACHTHAIVKCIFLLFHLEWGGAHLQRASRVAAADSTTL
jgi:hypothetical protein